MQGLTDKLKCDSTTAHPGEPMNLLNSQSVGEELLAGDPWGTPKHVAAASPSVDDGFPIAIRMQPPSIDFP